MTGKGRSKLISNLNFSHNRNRVQRGYFWNKTKDQNIEDQKLK